MGYSRGVVVLDSSDDVTTLQLTVRRAADENLQQSRDMYTRHVTTHASARTVNKCIAPCVRCDSKVALFLLWFSYTFLARPETVAQPPPVIGPPYNFFQRGVKGEIGLKCNKGALITSELGGVARRNFGN